MVIDYVRRFLRRRDSSKQKRVVRINPPSPLQKYRTNALKSGYKLDIYMSKSNDDARPWHSIEAAAYIPQNERNLLLRRFAEEIGLNIKEDDTVVEVYWKKKLSPGGKSYTYRMEFMTRTDLPCRVIFGKHDPRGMLPGFPHPFEGSAKQDFDESYSFSKLRTKSWRKLVDKTSSWGSAASNSRRSSFRQKMSPASTFAPSNPIPPKRVDICGRTQAVERDVEVQNATNGRSNANNQSAVESRAILDTGLSSVVEEAIQENPGSGCQNPIIHQRTVEFPLSGPCQIDHSKAELRVGSGVAPWTFEPLGSDANTRQTSVMGHRDELIAVDSVAGEDPKRPTASSRRGSEYVHNLPLNSVRNADFSASHETAVSLTQPKYLELELEPELIPKALTAVEKPLPRREIEGGSIETDPGSIKAGFKPSEESEADVHHPLQLDDLNDSGRDPVIAEPSLPPRESYSNTIFDHSMATEHYRSHGEIASYPVGKFLEQEHNSSQGKDKTPEAANASDHSSNQQESRSRKQIVKHQKAPKIRSAKLAGPEALQNVDLTPAPGAAEYWKYDEAAKAYYHIDSDTLSTLWYEESDSEDSDLGDSKK
jgi:hypothetical protein